MEQELVEVISSSRILPDRFEAEDEDKSSYDEDPPETLHEPAQSHDDARGKRQGDTEASKEVGKDRHHPLKQGADDEPSQADDGDGIDQSRFHGSFQANRLLDVDRQTLQDDIENTAGFASLNHVGGEVVEDVGI